MISGAPEAIATNTFKEAARQLRTTVFTSHDGDDSTADQALLTGNTLAPPLALRPPKAVRLFTLGVGQEFKERLPKDMGNEDESQTSVERDHTNIFSNLWDSSSLLRGAGSMFYPSTSPSKI